MPASLTDAARPVPRTAVELLDSLAESRERARRAEVDTMLAGLAWAHMHPASRLDDAATQPGSDRGLAIAGEGAPLVSDFAVVELATALGRSADSGRMWLGRVLELAHRLPSTWEALVDGPLEPWRAMTIARQTLLLSQEAAAWVDAQVAGRAHKVGPVVLERLVVEAAERFDPDETYDDEAGVSDRRRAVVHADQVHHGLVQVEATLDASDGRDLKAAIAKVAHELLGVGGRPVSPDVRRALALGEMARRELGRGSEVRGGGPARRDLTIYAHIDADALDQQAPGEPSWARVEHGGGSFTISLDRLQEWATVGGARVTIRPVIDLPATASVNGYEATERLREHVVLRRSTCAFPFCGRPARSADLDHIEPFDPDPPSAAPGGVAQTNTENLAPCCRRHHRAKTFAGWRYVQLSPGEYLWNGPHGQRLHVDHTGTTAL